MKRYLILYVILLNLTSCDFKDSNHKKEESKNKSTKQSKDKSIEQIKNNIIKIGFYETYEKLPKFKIDSCTKNDFEEIEPDTTFGKLNVERNSNYFFVKTSQKTLKFKEYHENDRDLNGNEFLGFNDKLKLYAIQSNSYSEGLGFADLTLIDSLSDYHYQIISLGDWSVSLPTASKNNQFFVYFQNPEYESKTLSIAVLKINTKEKPKSFLKEYSSCFVDNEMSIEEIRWKDDFTFYIKAYKSEIGEDGYEKKNYKYFFAKIK